MHKLVHVFGHHEILEVGNQVFLSRLAEDKPVGGERALELRQVFNFATERQEGHVPLWAGPSYTQNGSNPLERLLDTDRPADSNIEAQGSPERLANAASR